MRGLPEMPLQMLNTMSILILQEQSQAGSPACELASSHRMDTESEPGSTPTSSPLRIFCMILSGWFCGTGGNRS
jgi:hypothetical protein